MLVGGVPTPVSAKMIEDVMVAQGDVVHTTDAGGVEEGESAVVDAEADSDEALSSETKVVDVELDGAKAAHNEL